MKQLGESLNPVPTSPQAGYIFTPKHSVRLPQQYIPGWRGAL